jgi:hypothetical protein
LLGRIELGLHQGSLLNQLNSPLVLPKAALSFFEDLWIDKGSLLLFLLLACCGLFLLAAGWSATLLLWAGAPQLQLLHTESTRYSAWGRVGKAIHQSCPITVNHGEHPAKK